MRVLISFRGNPGPPTDMTHLVYGGGPPWIDWDKVVLNFGGRLVGFVIGSVEQLGEDWIIRDLVPNADSEQS
jgi:hypothetical protein